MSEDNGQKASSLDIQRSLTRALAKSIRVDVHSENALGQYDTATFDPKYIAELFDEITRLRAQVEMLTADFNDCNSERARWKEEAATLDALLERAVKAALAEAIDIVRRNAWKGLSLHHLRAIDPAAIVQKVKA